MDQGKKKGMADQDRSAGIDANQRKDFKSEETTAQRGYDASSHADDYDQNIGDPNINVKQFTNDVEYIDNRGPLGTGD